MALVGVFALGVISPVLAGAPVRYQQHDAWMLWRCLAGGPVRFQDNDRNGVLGIGDRVFMIRGIVTATNVAFLPGNSQDLIDQTRPGQTHLAGTQKRITVLSIDPATGTMELAQRANRIRNVYSDFSNIVGAGCGINFFNQLIIWTGRTVHQGTFFVIQPIASVAQAFPGAGTGAVVVHRPCNPSPNQPNPCNP